MGILGGLASLVPGVDVTPDFLETAVSYLGAFVTGGALGGAAYAINNGGDGTATQRFIEGAGAGGALTTSLYALMHYFS